MSEQVTFEALADLHSKGTRTFVMIAPVLPGAEGLVKALKGKVENVLIDKLNYHYADSTYKRYGMQWAMKAGFFSQKAEELKTAFEREGIPCPAYV